MKLRILMAFAIFCLTATVVSAQTGFAGKWVTDPPAATAAPAAPAAGGAPAGPGGGGRGGGRGGAQQTRLDFKVDGTKLTGTIFEGGAELAINEGTITGKQAKFKTVRPLNGANLDVNWTADLTDENTITLNREFPNGIPGGGGRGGGGGAAGGGAGGAGAPAGPPAAAAGGPPAGGPPAGAAAPGQGAPGGGGRGAGGRGGGGVAAVILHRDKN